VTRRVVVQIISLVNIRRTKRAARQAAGILNLESPLLRDLMSHMLLHVLITLPRFRASSHPDLSFALSALRLSDFPYLANVSVLRGFLLSDPSTSRPHFVFTPLGPRNVVGATFGFVRFRELGAIELRPNAERGNARSGTHIRRAVCLDVTNNRRSLCQCRPG
jgi:hypothetical protein